MLTPPCVLHSYALFIFRVYIIHFLLSLGMDERGGTTSWGTSGQPSPSYDSSRVSFLVLDRTFNWAE